MLRSPTRYVLAVVAAATAFAVVRLLHPVLDTGSYLVFLAAIIVAAGLLGLGPALLATVLAVASIDFFFLAPKYSLALLARADMLLLGLFGGIAALTSAMAEWLRRGRERAERDARTAAGIASLLHRDAEELSRDVDAMVALRRHRKSGS